MFTIRRYQKNDAEQVGILIAETYGDFDLPGMRPEKRASMLGPFAFAHLSAPERREAIAAAIEAPSVWVAEQGGEIVGVLRGGRTDSRGRTVLSSLFVSGAHHRQGIGSALVEQFEKEYTAQGVRVFKLMATLYCRPVLCERGLQEVNRRACHAQLRRRWIAISANEESGG